jgi:molybdopterin converting factor small subunit
VKIKVYAPVITADTEVLDDHGCLELPPDSILRDVYKTLKIPWALRRIIICTVNYRLEKLSKKLEDGDSVSFFGPVTGG